MAEKQINEYFRELPANYRPSSSTRLVGENEGQSLKVPIGVLGEAVELHPTPTNTLYDIRTALMGEDKTVSKPTFVQFKGAYTRTMIMWFEGDVTSSTATVHCWDLTNRKIYTAGSTVLHAVTIEEFLSSTYEVALGGDSSSGVTVSVTDSSALYEIIRTMLNEGLDCSVPHFVRLSGTFSQNILIWTTTHGGTSYAVYCWDLTNRKCYESAHLESTDVTCGEFFSSAYEVPLGSSSSSGSASYSFDVGETSTMLDLINDMESKGYTLGDTMCLRLKGAIQGNYIGYIDAWGGKSIYSLQLFEVSTTTLYSGMGENTSRPLQVALDAVTKTELAGGGAELFKDVELLPQDPSETVFYRTPDVTAAKWVFNRAIVTDGGMKCHVVDELPEVGEPCYTGDTMCAYFRRTTYTVYGYVDANLSSMMNVPVGWYAADTLFTALGYSYKGLITSLDQVSNDDYYLLLESSFKLHCYAQPLGTMVKVTIPTEESIKAYIDETILGGSW